MSLRAHPDVERRGESPGPSADTPDFADMPDAGDTPDTADYPDTPATNARRRADPITSNDTRDIPTRLTHRPQIRASPLPSGHAR